MLNDSSLSVLLLEKNGEPGHKICAGGITRTGYNILDIPDHIVEYKVKDFVLHSKHYQYAKVWPEAIVYTVNRLEFGWWQLQKLKDSNIIYRNNTRLTEVHSNKIVVNSNEEIGFRYLVGADGPNSLVRKFLKLPVEKVLASIQYIIPMQKVEPRIELFLENKYFRSWYAWSFPHRGNIAVGTCFNAHMVQSSKIKNNFLIWLEKNAFDISNADYQSFPISYDYRGFKFGNIYLAGEASGIASGFTGEGIYQSLVSGEIVAGMIIGNDSYKGKIKNILSYNRPQHRFLNFLNNIGPMRDVLFDLIIQLMKNKGVNNFITHKFS